MNKPTTAMKLSLCALALGTAAAQGAQFFRIAGPVATTITALSVDGYITWTNSPTNATFTVQRAQSLLSPINWVDYVQVPVTNAVTMERIYDPNPPSGMALIPAGSFTMGDTFDSESDALPLHRVYTSAFYMETNLVTYSLWTNVYQWATNHGYSFDNRGSGKAANHPVQTVNWYDLVKWCNARSEQEGRVPAYYTNGAQTVVYRTGRVDVADAWVKSSGGYRLPTEAEWEKAARGGAPGHRFPWSEADTIDWSRANYNADPGYLSYDVNPASGYNPAFSSGGEPYTSLAGSFAANGYGLYDMAGNVHEWCWDWYSSTCYSSSPGTDPKGPGSGTYRMLRGGSWSGSAIGARCAYRGYGYAVGAYDSTGFRCVRGS